MSIMDLGNKEPVLYTRRIQWTCRAEMPFDESHILEVLRAMKGLTNVRTGPEGYIHFTTKPCHQTHFTNLYPDMTYKEILQGLFRHRASTMDKVDLHRGWQTMKEGMEPNEEWYKD